MKKTSFRKSLVARIGSLIFAVVIAQAIFVLLAVIFTNIPGVMQNFSYTQFTQTVNNRKNYLSSEMINIWSDINSYTLLISESYDNAKEDNSEDFALDFFDKTTPILLNMLETTSTTGGFIILDDGDSLSNISNSAIYISNSNYASAIDESSILQMIAGPSEISKKHSLSLANSWTYGLNLSDENLPILTKPINAVSLTPNSDFCGYWAVTPSLSTKNSQMITYSVPLLDENSQPFGVLGIELSQDFIYKSLPFHEFSFDGSYGYSIATVDTKNNEIIPLMSQGTVQKSLFEINEPLPLEPFNINVSDSSMSQPMYIPNDIANVAVYYLALDLYKPNTPFEDDAFYLIGMTDTINITKFSDNVTSLFINLLIASLVFGLIISYFIGKRFAKPIVTLSKNVSEHKSGQPLSFKTTNIKEIDELSNSIVTLNRNVLNSAYKMDNILNQLNIKVGSYEYIAGEDTVMISRQLRRLMGLPVSNIYDLNVDRSIFFERLEQLKAEPIDDFESVYQVSISGDKWYRITEITQDGNTKLGVIMDVTKEVLEARAISYQRDYDVLTGLYNRAAFHRKALTILSRGNLGTTALIMFDLDNLKYLNDTFGHSMGDNYIKSAAIALQNVFDENCLLCRMSGDEFFVLFYNFESKEQVLNHIEKAYAEFDQHPITLPNSDQFKIRMSGGISWYDEDTTDLDELIRFADFAMYEGKFTLKGEIREFSKEDYISKSFMLSGKEELNRILDNQFVDFVFQPIVDAKDGHIYAYEALMRPQSDILDTPIKLLQISTAQSQLWKVEKITFFKTLSLYEEHLELFGDARLFINSIPNKTLREHEFWEFEQLYGKYLKNIVVEIIENEQLDDFNLNYKLDKIHSWDALVALDDYGSGYNNDLGLLNIKPDIVKLDRTIIANVDSDLSRQAVVDKIISFCKDQKIYVLAEGVETYPQMEYLLRAGVDFLQGYYISRPIPLPNFDSTEIKEKIVDLQETINLEKQGNN